MKVNGRQVHHDKCLYMSNRIKTRYRKHRQRRYLPNRPKKCFARIHTRGELVTVDVFTACNHLNLDEYTDSWSEVTCMNCLRTLKPKR